mgnify:FL=1
MKLAHAKTRIAQILMDQGVLRDEEWSTEDSDTGIVHVRKVNFDQAPGVATVLKINLIPNGPDHTYRVQTRILFYSDSVRILNYRSIANALAAIALYQEITNVAALIGANFEDHVITL